MTTNHNDMISDYDDVLSDNDDVLSEYDDIISLPHHTSKKHPRMSMLSRAAQFAPFAALSGHDEAIKETEIYE